MARNEEKHFGKLNRLYLLKEKEEYEKKNPKRPKLDTLVTVEEVQQWLPSIKKDIDFYLKKSQVTCYSDVHVEECRDKVIKLEKEFKAFVRKIKQLSPFPVETTPWTSRAYKRKSIDIAIDSSSAEFRPISTPVLDKKSYSDLPVARCDNIDLPLNDEPLNFSYNVKADFEVPNIQYCDSDLPSKDHRLHFSNNLITNTQVLTIHEVNYNMPLNKPPDKDNEHLVEPNLPLQNQKSEIRKISQNCFLKNSFTSTDSAKNNQSKEIISLVNYDSSDNEM